jgi:hypothetical protein
MEAEADEDDCTKAEGSYCQSAEEKQLDNGRREQLPEILKYTARPVARVSEGGNLLPSDAIGSTRRHLRAGRPVGQRAIRY